MFGKNFDSYREEAQSPLLIAMIENIKAVDSLAQILDVEGLDAILVGPYDLSASLGITAEFDNPLFTSAMAEIITSHNQKILPPVFMLSPHQSLN